MTEIKMRLTGNQEIFGNLSASDSLTVTLTILAEMVMSIYTFKIMN